MDFDTLARMRQSDRAYDPTRPVDRALIDQIVETALQAPSACNAQPYKIVIVDDKTLAGQVADCTSDRVLGMNHFTKQAPVHILIIEEKGNVTSTIGSFVKEKHFSWIDAGILASYICLAARDKGLGSCILGWFQEKKLKKLLAIPTGKRVLLDIVIGYSTQPLREKKRKKTDTVVNRNEYKK